MLQHITGYHNPQILLNQNLIQYLTIYFVTELINYYYYYLYQAVCITLHFVTFNSIFHF